MTLKYLKAERDALTASNSGYKVTVIGTLKKGEKLERGARDLGYFVFSPEYGDAKVRQALSLAFKKKYGPTPVAIDPVYLPENNWFDVNPDWQVCARAFYTTSTNSHIVAEGDGEFVKRYRSEKGGSLVRPLEPIPQGPTWPYSIKYTDKKGKRVEKIVECPFKPTLQITVILDGLHDYLPAEISERLPFRLAANFYSTAKNEVEPLYHALSNLRETFVDKQIPARSVPCSVTPLALYRHQVDDKRIIDDGQEQRITIYPTKLEMSKVLAEAFNSAQLANQARYLQYVSAGYLTASDMEEKTELPLAIAAPKLVDIQGDVNDLLFGAEPTSTPVTSRVISKPEVKDDIVEGDFVEKKDEIQAAIRLFRELGLKVPENLNNNKEVMKTLWEYNVGVGTPFATGEGTVRVKQQALVDVIKELMGEEIITNYWYENLCIYFFRTSDKCQEEFGKKDTLLDAKKWWDYHKNEIPF